MATKTGVKLLASDYTSPAAGRAYYGSVGTTLTYTVGTTVTSSAGPGLFILSSWYGLAESLSILNYLRSLGHTDMPRLAVVSYDTANILAEQLECFGSILQVSTLHVDSELTAP